MPATLSPSILQEVAHKSRSSFTADYPFFCCYVLPFSLRRVCACCCPFRSGSHWPSSLLIRYVTNQGLGFFPGFYAVSFFGVLSIIKIHDSVSEIPPCIHHVILFRTEIKGNHYTNCHCYNKGKKLRYASGNGKTDKCRI